MLEGVGLRLEMFKLSRLHIQLLPVTITFIFEFAGLGEEMAVFVDTTRCLAMFAAFLLSRFKVFVNNLRGGKGARLGQG